MQRAGSARSTAHSRKLSLYSLLRDDKVSPNPDSKSRILSPKRKSLTLTLILTLTQHMPD